MRTSKRATPIPTMTAGRLDRIVVPPPCRRLDMAANCGWVQSTAIRAGDFLFVSGVVAIDPESGERLNGTLTKIEIGCVALVG
jgi:enamine deaminase RidA (YjgF/YER057c/UK114 family)